MGCKEFRLHLVGARELKLMNVRFLNDILQHLKEMTGMLCGSGGETGSFPPITGCALDHQQIVVPSAKVGRGCRRRKRYGGGTS